MNHRLADIQRTISLKGSGGSNQQPGTAPTADENADKKVKQDRDLVRSGIIQQMEWCQSFKDDDEEYNGGVGWSFEGFAWDEDFVLRLFNIKASSKPFEQTRIPVRQFARLFGIFRVPSRHGDLKLCGRDIYIRWHEENDQFIISGFYGPC